MIDHLLPACSLEALLHCLRTLRALAAVELHLPLLFLGLLGPLLLLLVLKS